MVDYLGEGSLILDKQDSSSSAQNNPKPTSSYEYRIEQAASPSKMLGARGGEAPGKKSNNLWSHILTDVVKRDDLQDTTMLLLGDRGVGKRSLVREINAKYVLGKNKSMAVEKMGSDFSALDFSFLYVKDLTDKESAASYVTADDNLSRLNIWTL